MSKIKNNNPSSPSLIKTSLWKALKKHHHTIGDSSMRDMFLTDPERFKKFSMTAANLTLDYSKNRISEATLELLQKLAYTCCLPQKIEALFSGDIVNESEQLPALHTALRNCSETPVYFDKQNIMPKIHKTQEIMQNWVSKLHRGEWLGYSGKRITDVVNIGIGGSDLGAEMVTTALTPYHLGLINLHFVSNIDPTHITQTLQKLNRETTLFIIASKSFETLETLSNATTARQWLNNEKKLTHHFIAITANNKAAKKFGISESNILLIDKWIGGRYSLWSAMGLPIALAIGMKKFDEFLTGAYAMDQHFRHANYSENMPVILALLSVWYTNFFNISSHAILPYDQYLIRFPDYLQQLIMESNGKSVCQQGEKTQYSTSPIIWGKVGCNGQHSFHQLLHQGSHLISTDFIISLSTHNPIREHHAILYADCLSQSEALMRGLAIDEAYKSLILQGYSKKEAKQLAPHITVPGNRPSNIILLPELNPKTLGALIALYEHKTFVESVIWDINPFDQWGIQLGKQMGNQILSALTNNKKLKEVDCSTQNLVDLYQNFQKNSKTD